MKAKGGGGKGRGGVSCACVCAARALRHAFVEAPRVCARGPRTCADATCRRGPALASDRATKQVRSPRAAREQPCGFSNEFGEAMRCATNPTRDHQHIMWFKTMSHPCFRKSVQSLVKAVRAIVSHTPCSSSTPHPDLPGRCWARATSLKPRRRNPLAKSSVGLSASATSRARARSSRPSVIRAVTRQTRL